MILVGLVAFLRQTDLDQVGYYLKAMGWNYLYIILITFVAMLMGTIAWRYTFEEETIHGVSFLRLFTIRLVGENIGLINPSNVIGGDTFKGYLLSKEGIAVHQSVSSLVLARVMMMVTQIMTFIIAGVIFAFFVRGSVELQWVLGASISLLVVIAIIVFVAMRFGLVNVGVHKRLQRWGMSGLQYQLKKIYVQLRSFYRDHRRRFYIAGLFNMLNWVIGSLEFWLIFYFLSSQITMLDALLVDQGVLVLKSFGAFIPGQLGVEEFANKIMLSIVGVKTAGLWVAASILRRSRQVFWILVSGALYAMEMQWGKGRSVVTATS